MNRVAVVTGGASGIGLGVARHLAADGHRIAVFDQHGQAAERAAADLRADGASALAAKVMTRATIQSRHRQQASAQAGSLPSLTRCAQSMHFSTVPRRWGTGYSGL